MDTRQEILIEGMTCSACALSVSSFLVDKGLENIHVDVNTGTVTFENPEHVDASAISSGIKKLGYKVAANNLRKISSTREFWFIVSMVFTLPLLLHMLLPFPLLHNAYFQFALTTPVIFIGIRYFGKSAIGSLKNGEANMDVLILMGALSAFIYSCVGTFILSSTDGHYLFFETAASIISLVMLGNIIESRAVAKTRSAVDALMRMQPRRARILTGIGSANEKIIEIDASKLLAGDIVQVNNGDQIPADGIILDGSAKIDESAMTGESELLLKKLNDSVLCGTVVNDGSIRVKVQKTGSETALSKIIKLMQDAQFSKPAVQKLADKISAWFVPVVISISVITYLISTFLFDLSVGESLMRSIAVLVISCPCAMGLATPTALAVGIGRASSRGLLIKDPNALELIDQAKIFVFDKTGTLTDNRDHIDRIRIEKGFEEDDVLGIILSVEKHSTHPLALAITNYLQHSKLKPVVLNNVHEHKGKGLVADTDDGRSVKIGSGNFTGISSDGEILVVINSVLAATVFLKRDVIKPESYKLISYLKSRGIKTVLLSGDKKEKCERVAKELKMDEWFGEQLPDDKLHLIEIYNKEGFTVMVGDGINDAPPLEKATVGISINDASQIAMNAADIIISKRSDISAVNDAIIIGKHTYLTIKQNLLWALLYNVVAIPLAALGFLSPIIGVITMAFSDLVVIGNSIRLKTKNIF